MGQMDKSIRAHTVAVIGGGFTGSLFALKILKARPDWTVLLVEDRVHAGRGIAYGACEAQHLLNVPVSRMELGLEPGFGAWLCTRPGLLQDALIESNGRLENAFVPGDCSATIWNSEFPMPFCRPTDRAFAAFMAV